MTFANYNLNLPNGPDNPSNDQPGMQVNTNSIANLIAIDHIGFNLNNGGYHTLLHMPSQGSFPANIPTQIAGMVQFDSLLYTPPTIPPGAAHAQLYATNDGGTVQMTGFQQSTRGWCWAGMLVQWGTIALTSSSGHKYSTVTFADAQGIPFTTCYNVQATLQVVSTGELSNSNSIMIQNVTPTGFTWVANTSSSGGVADLGGFYWMAIGN